jgi:hypothetical protein
MHGAKRHLGTTEMLKQQADALDSGPHAEDGQRL